VLTRKADYDEAEKKLREALAIRKALYGDDHPEVAATLTTLPRCCRCAAIPRRASR
jgi:hypothetical protein